MRHLVFGIHPHVIPAPTIPSGMLERAMSEPLGHDRDEVIYLVCTHERLRFGAAVSEDGWRTVHRAVGDIGGIAWEGSPPWAEVKLPDEVAPSALGWAVLDPGLESLEGLSDPDFDPEKDLEGEAGRHRAELLPWVFDRHCESADPANTGARGLVRRGEINFRLEYVGKASQEALRRAAGAHHKLPLILGWTLVYEPSRLVYVLPCEIHAAAYDPETTGPIDLSRLREAATDSQLPRDLLIAAAEEALIEAFQPTYNQRNTQARRFPKSDAGDRLAASGIDDVFLVVGPLPPRLTIQSANAAVRRDSKAFAFRRD